MSALAGRDDVEVNAMVRNLDAFTTPAGNITAIKGDMDDPATLAAAVDGVTDVFLVSPMDERIATREINVIDAVVARVRMPASSSCTGRSSTLATI